MKQDLVSDFFARDLSDRELAALRDSLASEETAMQFSQKAKDFHRTLGAIAVVSLVAKLATTGLKSAGGASAATSGALSTGSVLAGKLMVAKAVGAALGAAIIAGSGVVAYKAYVAPAAAIVTPVRAIEPLAPVVVAPATPKRAPKAVAQPATQRGKQLVLRLTLEEAAVVETVVMDAAGNFVSTLGKLNMDAGVNRLVWNGRAADGSALAAGRYQIVTRWNGKEMTRWVELQAASVD